VDDHFTVVDEVVNGLLVEHRAVHEPEAAVLPGAIEVGQTPGVERVEDDHVVAALQERVDEVRSDEPRATGHEKVAAHSSMLDASTEGPSCPKRMPVAGCDGSTPGLIMWDTGRKERRRAASSGAWPWESPT
jgi:hypothetical protein